MLTDKKKPEKPSSMSVDNVHEALDWNVSKLTDVHVREIEWFNKYYPEQTKEHYDMICSNYEGVYKFLGYPDPQMVADAVKKLAKKKLSELNVLDLGSEQAWSVNI